MNNREIETSNHDYQRYDPSNHPGGFLSFFVSFIKLFMGYGFHISLFSLLLLDFSSFECLLQYGVNELLSEQWYMIANHFR